MSIDNSERPDPIDVPEHVGMVASTDGRIFVDVDYWVTEMHRDVHDMEQITRLVAGDDFYEGQHRALVAQHQLIDEMRAALGLPALFPEDEPEVPDATEAPSDEPEALDEVISLEDWFSRPAYGEQ